MAAEIVDSHTHLDAPEFDKDRDDVVARALAAGVTRIVTIGAAEEFASAERAIALTQKYPCVFAAVGIHPQDAKTPVDVKRLETLAKSSKVVAIGETGLDYYRDWAPRADQETWFIAQIELAISLKKPLVIHSRDAGEDCFRILRDHHASKVGGVFHCYAEGVEFAKRLEEINFIVSFPGPLTFKKADALRGVAKEIPLERIMVETDAPFMAPEPHRGGRCESSYVVETARVLARIKELSLDEVAEATTANAKKLFNLP